MGYELLKAYTTCDMKKFTARNIAKSLYNKDSKELSLL